MSDLVNCIRNADKVIKLLAFVKGLIRNGDCLNIGTERIGRS